MTLRWVGEKYLTAVKLASAVLGIKERWLPSPEIIWKFVQVGNISSIRCVQTPLLCALDGGFLFSCETPPVVSGPYPTRLIRLKTPLVMITTGGDKPIKFWDNISKTVTETLQGHTLNVSFAVY